MSARIARGHVIERMFLARYAALPRWYGWMPRRYRPNARYRIPYMPRLYWHIEGRRLLKAQPTFVPLSVDKPGE